MADIKEYEAFGIIGKCYLWTKNKHRLLKVFYINKNTLKKYKITIRELNDTPDKP